MVFTGFVVRWQVESVYRDKQLQSRIAGPAKDIWGDGIWFSFNARFALPGLGILPLAGRLMVKPTGID
jgi:hypothetical protein